MQMKVVKKFVLIKNQIYHECAKGLCTYLFKITMYVVFPCHYSEIDDKI